MLLSGLTRTVDEKGDTGDDTMAALTRDILAAREAEIQALVEQDRRDEAGKKLFDLIVACAQGGDLNTARRLRDLLYDVDPMALTVIIKANEIIDEAMSGAVSDEFTRAWTGLKEALNGDEFLALYHALEEHEVEADKVIVKAGSKLDAVFFVTRGHIRVMSQCGGKSCEVKVLEPGMMLSENCFHPSFWTVSLVSMTPAAFMLLRLEKLVEIENGFPGFENRLTGYYEQFNDIYPQLQDKELQRRKFERSRVDHKMVFQVLAKDGTEDERVFRGELDNISPGGLAFLIRIVKRENRRMLFGRKLLVSVPCDGKKLQFTGHVVAVTVNNLQDHDYAVHVAFEQSVPQETIQPLIPPEPIEAEEMPEQDEADDTQAE